MALQLMPAVDGLPDDYTELTPANRVALSRSMIQNAEQQLMQARSNLRIQDRLINSPVSESRKSAAKRARQQIIEQIQDIQISIGVLREELEEIEATVPIEVKDDDSDE